MTELQPFREPLRITLTRTLLIAAVAGLIASSWMGGVRRWPVLFAMMLWPSFGGHWIDLFFLNWMRQRLPDSAGFQRGARLALWFAGGIVLALGARWTLVLISGYPPARWPTWSVAAATFVAIELVAHAAIHARGRPSFYTEG